MADIVKVVVDENGNIVNVGKIEGTLPDNWRVEEREMEYDAERGWYEYGKSQVPTDAERINMLENMILLIMEG